MIYKNPNYKKIRGSHILIVSCGYCKTDIAKYQKVGRGNVLRMYVRRIIRTSTKLTKNLKCPNCGEVLGHRIILKEKNKEAYRMIRSSFNTREVNS